MKRIIIKLRLFLLSAILFSCGLQQSTPPKSEYSKIELEFKCTIYKGSVEIIILSYEKDPVFWRSHYREDEYELSPENNKEEDVYKYSNPSYALLVIGKGENAILVTDRDSIQMEDGQYITVIIERYSYSDKTVPIKSVLIQD